MVAHILALEFSSRRADWETVVQIAEAGLDAVARIQSEMGRALYKLSGPAVLAVFRQTAKTNAESYRSHTTLSTHLAIALVHWEVPSHHLRALRLLDSLISANAAPSAPLLVAQAYLFQHAAKWDAANAVWQRCLELSLPSALTLEVQGEAAWCTVNSGDLLVGHELLLAVVASLEALQAGREEEKLARNKLRALQLESKLEGVAEGETLSESFNRARAWWRVGICRQKLAGELTFFPSCSIS